MRLIIFISLVFLSISCASTKKTASDNERIKLSKFNGSWLPIKQEFGGNALPKAAYEKEKLIINDSTYTVIAESVDKGILRYKDDKMDIYGREGVNAGKHFTAIYKYENEQLTVCYNLSGDSYPLAFETKSKPTLFLSIFIKEVKK
jgi:uncharacterized protein (TIGR03067 family)